MLFLTRTTPKGLNVNSPRWQPNAIKLSLGEHAGSPLQPRHDVGFGRGIPACLPLTKVALRWQPGVAFNSKFLIQNAQFLGSEHLYCFCWDS
ncbi:MAG: hypothetical protein DRQ99_18100 [Candidatus Parabeggiatoa sp. nov. 3]|nr:MAG: hypothetical protein DRQ99_18100 [Gammaproteobacteria bacterium]